MDKGEKTGQGQGQRDIERDRETLEFLGNSKKQRKTAKTCRQFSACTIRRVPLSSF